MSRLKDYVDAVMVSDGEFAKRLASALDELFSSGISVWVTVKWQDRVVGRYHPSVQPDEPENGNVHKRDFPLNVGSVHIALKLGTGAGRAYDDIFDEIKQICSAHWGNRDASVLIDNVKISDRAQERLNEALRRAAGAEITALRLDLDKFKAVNTQWGEAIGDEVLIEFAARVRKHLADTSLVVRQGGDEFFAFFIGIPFDDAFHSINNFHMEMGDAEFKSIKEVKTASIGVTRILGSVSDFKSALKPATLIEEHLKNNEVRNFIALAAEPVTGAKPVAAQAAAGWRRMSARNGTGVASATPMRQPR